MRQATKLIYLVLRVNITKKWEKPPITWKLAASQICDQIREKIFRSRRRLKTMKKWRVVSNDLTLAGYSQLARLEPTALEGGLAGSS
jgi:hypothetical protein